MVTRVRSKSFHIKVDDVNLVKTMLEATSAAMIYSLGIMVDVDGSARDEVRKQLLPAYEVACKALKVSGVEAIPEQVNSLEVDLLSHLGYLRISVVVVRGDVYEPYCIHFLPVDGRNIAMRQVKRGQSAEVSAAAIAQTVI